MSRWRDQIMLCYKILRSSSSISSKCKSRVHFIPLKGFVCSTVSEPINLNHDSSGGISNLYSVWQPRFLYGKSLNNPFNRGESRRNLRKSRPSFTEDRHAIEVACTKTQNKQIKVVKMMNTIILFQSHLFKVIQDIKISTYRNYSI